VTVAEALDAYADHLRSTGGDPYNAKRARLHVPAAIASKPIGLIGAAELIKWRDGLTAKGLSRGSVNRVRTCLRAALTLAAKRDRRIVNQRVWQDDLDALPNATEARNVILSDAEVSRLITAGNAHDAALGLLMRVLAETCARPSQVRRIEVSVIST